MPFKTSNALLHGTLDALILKTLVSGPRHGYSIAKFIEDASDESVVVEEGSLYPALYRMERRGWLEAEWVSPSSAAGPSSIGVLAYSVQQRTRELGVRIALGATPVSVIRLVVSGVGRIVALGTALGLLIAAALGQAIASFLFGVQPLDLTTFVAVAGVLVITAAAAMTVPALRAVSVDPVEAFR